MNNGRGCDGPITIPVTVEARSIEHAAAKPDAAAKARLEVPVSKVAKTDFIPPYAGCPEESFRGQQRINFTQRIFIAAKISRVTHPAS